MKAQNCWVANFPGQRLTYDPPPGLPFVLHTPIILPCNVVCLVLYLPTDLAHDYTQLSLQT